MKRAATFVSAVAVSLGLASVAASSPTTVSFFQTPSRNIGCVYGSALSGQPAYLRCDVRSQLRNPVPRKPKACDLDYGDSIGMRKTGRPSLTCHGDTALDPRARVLAYGTTWSRDGFTCRSQTIGLRCSNSSGHGFFLSRERWYTF